MSCKIETEITLPLSFHHSLSRSIQVQCAHCCCKGPWSVNKMKIHWGCVLHYLRGLREGLARNFDSWVLIVVANLI